MNQLLESRILKSLRPALGKRLTAVTYCVLDNVREGKGEGALRGEIKLTLHENDLLYLTWDENAGWHDHFSIAALGQSSVVPNSLISIDAACLPLWNPHLGQLLSRIVVIEWNSTPHAIVFYFTTGSVVIYDGRRGGEFGDADELVVERADVIIPLFLLCRGPDRA